MKRLSDYCELYGMFRDCGLSEGLQDRYGVFIARK